MRVGTIAYDCASGLGNLAKAFYDHGLIQEVLVVPHPHYPRYPERFPPEHRYSKVTYDIFLSKIDTLLIFETAVGNLWDVVRRAREIGIRIVLMPMYEYSPFPTPVKPDLVVCPSLLDVDIYRSDYETVFIPVPVEVKWKQRDQAITFLHNAGHGQHDFAKGTPLVIEAMDYVKSPVRLRVTGQPSERQIGQLFRKHKDNPRIEIITGDLPYEELFSYGDVYINAEQFNGLSLPLQEARAAGMLVMTTDRYPTNTWLPREPLIPVESYYEYRIAIKFQRAKISPLTIAQKIDEWYGRDISQYSQEGKQWAEENSWEKLKPLYVTALMGNPCHS